MRSSESRGVSRPFSGAPIASPERQPAVAIVSPVGVPVSEKADPVASSVSETRIIGSEGIRKSTFSGKEAMVSQSVTNRRAEIFSTPKSEASQESVAVEREMFPASCATCGVAISVPFKPVATRPTFCRDCLRDYQRATAKVRGSMGAKSPEEPGRISPRRQEPVVSDDRTMERRHAQSERYLPNEAPMSLSQVQHIQPKAFKPLRKKSDVNLDDVRSIIHTMRKPVSEEEKGD